MLIGGKTMVQASVTRTAGNQDLQMIISRFSNDIRYSNVNVVSISSGTPRAVGILSAYDSKGAIKENFLPDRCAATRTRPLLVPQFHYSNPITSLMM
jgi:hypothetical protein